jgi:flagellar secretion chaperone FliS
MPEQPKKPTQNHYETYRKTDVMTANRETILLMMYAGAIRFTKRAIDATERGDVPEKGSLIGKVQEIITELRSTLDFEVGGDIAKNLDRLYLFITQCLIQASIEKKSDKLKDALKILTTLNEAWEAAIESLKKEKSQG